MIAKRYQEKQSHPAFFFFTKKASSWLAFRTSASMIEMELMDGIEPSTSPLPRVCSTPELHEPNTSNWSGRRESNPHHQLGRLRFYH